MPATNRYIALLRGINVGGHRKIIMADLRDMFHEMGFQNVQTYIQSGNVIFDTTSNDRTNLAAAIKKQIEETFGHDVPVILCTATELKNVLAEIPFESKDGWKRYITFLSDQPSAAEQERMESQSSAIETFRVGNKVVYIHVDKQTNKRPTFFNSFIQSLQMDATNRNIRSCKKILALAQG